MSPSQTPERLFTVRGANTVVSNDAGAIGDATRSLLEAIIARNALDQERIVSCIFTTTDDLDAEFPAVAAREMGLDRVPLLCAREIDVPGAMSSLVRVLVHYYGAPDHTPEPVYLGDAASLRTDLGGSA
jgi:chorismate mutase